MSLFVASGICRVAITGVPSFDAEPVVAMGAPVWSSAPIYSITSGQVYSNISVPVSARGTSIALAWSSSSTPSTKPTWITLHDGDVPAISFSSTQGVSDDVSVLVITATANGQSVDSEAGFIAVNAPQVGENPPSSTATWTEFYDLLYNSTPSYLVRTFQGTVDLIGGDFGGLKMYMIDYDKTTPNVPITVPDGWAITEDRVVAELPTLNNWAPIWGGYGQILWDEEFGDLAVVMPG